MAAHGAPPPGGGLGPAPTAPAAPAAPATPAPQAAPPAATPLPARPIQQGVAVDFDFRKQDCGVDYTDPRHPKRKWIVTIYAFDGYEEPAKDGKFKIFFLDGANDITVSSQPGSRGFWSETYYIETGSHEIRATLMEGGKDRFLTLYGVSKKQRKPFLKLPSLTRGSSFWANFWRGFMGDDR
jgi:hypothetical protein